MIERIVNNKTNDVTILMEDHISANNQNKTISAIDSDHVKRSKSPVFYTEVEMYKKYEGDDSDGLGDLFTVEHNELNLPGALFLAEKLTNTNSPIKPKTLNSDLGIEVNETPSQTPGQRRENVIGLFGVGIGGSGDVVGSVKPVYYRERKLEGLIPIRRVPSSEDLTTLERQKYYMRKQNGNNIDYYLKKFEIDPNIHCVYDEAGSPSVPPNFDEVTGDKVINTYMQFNIKISKDDVREYFKSSGGLNVARINTLGLYFGYPVTVDGQTEYRGVQLFSKLNFNNEPLDNETKELNIIYKIFIS